MDTDRFDHLARSFSGATSRRGAVRLLAGAALGGLLTRLGLEEAAAACAGIGRRCGDGRRCCGGAVCRDGTCRCPKGRKRCGSRCIPDDACCGGCRNCGVCAKGECEPATVPICGPCQRASCDEDSGAFVCEGEPAADGQQCRFAGTACGVCRGGRCDYTCKECETCGGDGCIPDAANNGGPCGGGTGKVCCLGACVDTQTDRNNCGACGKTCGPGEECAAGACRPVCPDGQEWCGGSCCPAGKCHEGKVCCAGTFSKFCPGNPATCCRPEYHCKTGPNGNAICSSNP